MRIQHAIVILGAAVAACSGGSSGGEKGSGAFCANFAENGAQLSESCAGCNIANQHAAVDGNLESAADVTAPSGATASPVTVTFTATAPSGVAFPAGSTAGAFATDGMSCTPCGVVISTFLGGQPQESASPTSAPGSDTDVNGNGSPAQSYFGIKTTKAFDTVEISDSGTGPNGFGPQDTVLKVYEICSNGGVR